MMELVERDSSSPASTRVHASLCIERSTRARSGEYAGVGRARSRARVPSCQRQCPIHRRKRGKHAFQHLHLHGDGATIAPWCNHVESTATMRPPPRFGEGPARLAAHLWLNAALAQSVERICTRGEPDGAATWDLGEDAAPAASPYDVIGLQTQIPSGRRPAPVTG